MNIYNCIVIATIAIAFQAHANVDVNASDRDMEPMPASNHQFVQDFDANEELDLAEADAHQAEMQARAESYEVAGLFNWLSEHLSVNAKPSVEAPTRPLTRREMRRLRREQRRQGFEPAPQAPAYPGEPGTAGEPSGLERHLKQGRCRTMRGMASWYGPGFRGHRTASGQPFTNGFYAAHRTLPMGSRVMVTNLANNRQVPVTINDRGPFVGGRIIDVTQAVRNALGMGGTAMVSLDACL